LAVALIGGYAAIMSWPASSAQHGVAADAIVAAASLIGLVLVCRAAWHSARLSPPLGRLWLIIVMVQLAAALGEFAVLSLDFGVGRPAYASLPELFFQARYLLIVVAIVALPKAPIPAGERMRVLLDALILMTAAALMVWAAFFVPALQQASGSSPVVLAVKLIYPLGDVVLLWAVTAAVVRRSVLQPVGPAFMLAIALALALGIDLMLDALPMSDAFQTGHWHELVWTLSYAALAVSSLWQTRLMQAGSLRPATPARARLPAWPWSIYLAWGWLAACYLLLIATENEPRLSSVHQMTIYVSGLLTVLVLIRHLLAFRDNKQLYAELRQNQSQLEARVTARTAELALANVELQAKISERKRAEAAQLELRVLAEALRDTAVALSSTLNLDELLDQIVDHISRVVPHDGASIGLVDGPSRAPSTFSMRSQGASHAAMVVLPASWLEQVMRSGRPLIVSDVAAAAPDDFQPGLAGVAAYLGVPIISKGQPIGLLNLTSASPGFFTELHGQRLMAFAGQAAVAIENARLYERVQRQAEEIGALYRASAKLLDTGGDLGLLAQQIASAVTLEFGQANCGVLLIDESGTGLSCLAAAGDYPAAATALMPLSGRGLVVAAFLTGQRVYSPEVATDPRYVPRDPRIRSQLVVPLDSGRHVLGVLDLHSREPDAFDERVQRIVTAYAGHAALALDSARLLIQLGDALGRANQLAMAAQEASRLKSEFLANTSHELRTPLTGIIGSLSLVLEGLCETPAEEQQFVNTAFLAAKHLLHVINDILDIAKIEAGHMDIRPQIVSIGPLLEEVRQIVAPDAAAKQLSLTVAASPTADQTVFADPSRLKQILLNLVSNAVKFTQHGGVTLRVTPDASARQLHIDVQDTGIGIASDTQGLLFQPFVQLDGGLDRRFGGTGLGLSIARHLAEMMNGSLALESAGEGLGSTFRLSLPLED